MWRWLEQVAELGQSLLGLVLLFLLVCVVVGAIMVASGTHVPFYAP